MSGPFIITDWGFWVVGSDVTKNRGGIESKRSGLTTPPRSGWEYDDGTSKVLDDTLLFQPGDPAFMSGET